MEDYFTYETIGTGVKSSVLKARRKRTLVFIAAKRSQRGTERQLTNEVACLVAMPRHANVISFYGWFLTDNHVYRLLEYAAGGSLARITARDSGTPETSLLLYAENVVPALHHVHSSGYLMCELDVSSVLLTEDGTCKLSRFHAAQAYSRGSAPPRQQRIVPSSAPELAIEHAIHTRASDLWSLGYTLYTLACSHPPRGPVLEPPVLPDARGSPHDGIPPSTALWALLAGLLCPDPARRFTWADLLGHPWWTGTGADLGAGAGMRRPSLQLLGSDESMPLEIHATAMQRKGQTSSEVVLEGSAITDSSTAGAQPMQCHKDDTCTDSSRMDRSAATQSQLSLIAPVDSDQDATVTQPMPLSRPLRYSANAHISNRSTMVMGVAADPAQNCLLNPRSIVYLQAQHQEEDQDGLGYANEQGGMQAQARGAEEHVPLLHTQNAFSLDDADLDSISVAPRDCDVTPVAGISAVGRRAHALFEDVAKAKALKTKASPLPSLLSLSSIHTALVQGGSAFSTPTGTPSVSRRNSVGMPAVEAGGQSHGQSGHAGHAQQMDALHTLREAVSQEEVANQALNSSLAPVLVQLTARSTSSAVQCAASATLGAMLQRASHIVPSLVVGNDTGLLVSLAACLEVGSQEYLRVQGGTIGLLGGVDTAVAGALSSLRCRTVRAARPHVACAFGELLFYICTQVQRAAEERENEVTWTLPSWLGPFLKRHMLSSTESDRDVRDALYATCGNISSLAPVALQSLDGLQLAVVTAGELSQVLEALIENAGDNASVRASLALLTRAVHLLSLPYLYQAQDKGQETVGGGARLQLMQALCSVLHQVSCFATASTQNPFLWVTRLASLALPLLVRGVTYGVPRFTAWSSVTDALKLVQHTAGPDSGGKVQVPALRALQACILQACVDAWDMEPAEALQNSSSADDDYTIAAPALAVNLLDFLRCSRSNEENEGGRWEPGQGGEGEGVERQLLLNVSAGYDHERVEGGLRPSPSPSAHAQHGQNDKGNAGMADRPEDLEFSLASQLVLARVLGRLMLRCLVDVCDVCDSFASFPVPVDENRLQARLFSAIDCFIAAMPEVETLPAALHLGACVTAPLIQALAAALLRMSAYDDEALNGTIRRIDINTAVSLETCLRSVAEMVTGAIDRWEDVRHDATASASHLYADVSEIHKGAGVAASEAAAEYLLPAVFTCMGSACARSAMAITDSTEAGGTDAAIASVWPWLQLTHGFVTVIPLLRALPSSCMPQVATAAHKAIVNAAGLYNCVSQTCGNQNEGAASLLLSALLDFLHAYLVRAPQVLGAGGMELEDEVYTNLQGTGKRDGDAGSSVDVLMGVVRHVIAPPQPSADGNEQLPPLPFGRDVSLAIELLRAMCTVQMRSVDRMPLWPSLVSRFAADGLLVLAFSTACLSSTRQDGQGMAALVAALDAAGAVVSAAARTLHALHEQDEGMESRSVDCDVFRLNLSDVDVIAEHEEHGQLVTSYTALADAVASLLPAAITVLLAVRGSSSAVPRLRTASASFLLTMARCTPLQAAFSVLLVTGTAHQLADAAATALQRDWTASLEEEELCEESARTRTHAAESSLSCPFPLVAGPPPVHALVRETRLALIRALAEGDTQRDGHDAALAELLVRALHALCESSEDVLGSVRMHDDDDEGLHGLLEAWVDMQKREGVGQGGTQAWGSRHAPSPPPPHVPLPGAVAPRVVKVGRSRRQGGGGARIGHDEGTERATIDAIASGRALLDLLQPHM